MAPFRVIIVGGSIAGLALANMLEQYDVDYVLLEKYPSIAPQVGAGFAIQPNGARILQQLGCYKPLEAANEPVNSLSNVSYDGSLRLYDPEFGRWLQESYGSKMRFMDRRKIIETLYENLRDKSKILTSHEVVKIFSHSDGAEIETKDGVVFHGDLIVGADGIHSRVRQEMQRIAAEDTPGRDLFPEDDAFTCDYRAIFGISKAPEGIIPDQSFKWFGEGRNYLCASGPNGTLYWIFDMKNEERTQGKSIPRYTEDDMFQAADLYRDDVIKEGITFGDLFDNRIRATMVPVEEGILKNCFYKRIVLLGDSWHKVNPLGGLGGNTAIQSATILINELKDAILAEGNPSEARLGLALQHYQQGRQTKSSGVVEQSRQIQKMEALETPVARFIQLKLAKYISPESMANAMCQWYAAAPRLKHLPLPPQFNLLPFTDEIKMKPKSRSKNIAFTFGLFLAAMVFLLYPHLQQEETIVTYEAKKSIVSKYTGLDRDRSLQLHYNLSITVITAIISIESYRRSLHLSLLASALPFGIASIFVGWEVVAPAYFTLFVLSTGAKSYYYPCPRSIDLATTQAFFFAYLVNYLPSIVCTFGCSTFPSSLWSISHATLPLTIWPLARWIARRSTGNIRGPAVLWGDQDIKYTNRFFYLMRVFSLVGYLFSVPLKGDTSQAKLIPLYRLVVQASSFDPSEVRILLLDVIMMTFLCFMIWDLRRINVSTAGLSTILLAIANALLFGPAVALAQLWSTRETEWEASRQRRAEPIGDKITTEKA